MTLLAVYCALFILMGLHEFFKRKDFEEFAVAGRRSGAGLVGVSIVASCVGASATIGMTGLAFTAGFPAFWWLGSGAAGLLVLGFLLARKVRKSGVYTLPDMAEKFISPTARRLMALIIIPAWTSILAAQYIAAGKIVTALTGMAPTTALAACAALITAYTVLGGQNSILKSDAVQFSMLAAGLLLALGFTAVHSPVSLADIPLQFTNDAFPLSRWTYFMLIVGGSYVVCPMLFGRLLSAKDDSRARRGTLLAAAGLALCALVVVALGLYARGLATPGTDPDAILTQVIPAIMPGWAGIVLLFALLSAIVSSADSCLHTAATVLEHDLLGDTNVARCRLIMVAIGLGAVGIALCGGSILSLLLAANDIYVCGVVCPMAVAILAHGKRAINPRAMVLALILGGACGVAAASTGAKGFSYAGVAVSFTLSLLALLPRPASKSRRAVPEPASRG
ncbi:sodium:solute symporter family protein [Pseudodesulfovibrio sp.]|uniref:sodium:solute symporter family protein n=1 Tax=unclassified Pseudodesulfovibrio TaxID=2661612 RepID=UPI003B00D724